MRLASFLLVPLILSSVSEADHWWLEDFEAVRNLSGEGVVIAVIDTGIDASHPDLAGGGNRGSRFFGCWDTGWN